MTSVRDLIRGVQREMRDTADLVPSRATELLNHTTALLGNVNDELRIADAEYKRVLLHCLRNHEKANRARIEAETSHRCRACSASHGLDVHHVIARSLGGRDEVLNLISVCRSCHESIHGRVLKLRWTDPARPAMTLRLEWVK